jgi:hypothetical protein
MTKDRSIAEQAQDFFASKGYAGDEPFVTDAAEFAAAVESFKLTKYYNALRDIQAIPYNEYSNCEAGCHIADIVSAALRS